MNCKQCKELLVEALYKELPQHTQTEFQTHISSCAECAAEYTKMESTLNIMSERIMVEPATNAIEYWNSIRAKIDITEEKQRLLFFKQKLSWQPERIPVWAYSIAALLLITAGIYMGRIYWKTEQTPGSEPLITPLIATTSDQDTLNEQVMTYLERSKNLLLGVMNTSDDYPNFIPSDRYQQMSRQLIHQANYFKAELNQPEQQQLKQLIYDLEVVLMQLANVELRPGVPAVELVKKGVDKKSILLKINIEEIRAAACKESQTQKTKNLRKGEQS